MTVVSGFPGAMAVMAKREDVRCGHEEDVNDSMERGQGRPLGWDGEREMRITKAETGRCAREAGEGWGSRQ